jgi:hypothetical protein
VSNDVDFVSTFAIATARMTGDHREMVTGRRVRGTLFFRGVIARTKNILRPYPHRSKLTRRFYRLRPDKKKEKLFYQPKTRTPAAANTKNRIDDRRRDVVPELRIQPISGTAIAYHNRVYGTQERRSERVPVPASRRAVV